MGRRARRGRGRHLRIDDWSTASGQARPWVGWFQAHRWRAADDIVRQIDSAWRCVGLYAPDGAQVGFARVVSDGVALGYLADAYVLAAHRSKGLGLAMIREAVDSQPSWRWMSHTADGHALYAKLGFQPAPDTYFERPRQ